jgi:hypothetical protein
MRMSRTPSPSCPNGSLGECHGLDISRRRRVILDPETERRSAKVVEATFGRSSDWMATLRKAVHLPDTWNASKGARQFPVNPPPGYEGDWPPAWW